MRSTLAIAALAGIALAAPHYGANPQQDNHQVEQVYWVVETIVETVTVYDDAQPTDTPQQPAYQPAVTTVAYQAAASTPAPYQAQKPSATPQPSQAYQPPANTDTGYMAVVNKYRAMMGKPAFTQSSMLEGNANKCVTESQGQMIHELNPGSYGQVLAPGGPSDFEHVFVGGWICEKPSLLGDQSSICNQQSQGWMYDGTGHADILSSTDYTQIGCACVDNIWGCDVA